MFVPNTYAWDWSDRDACKHAIDAAAMRGIPSARILLPYDRRRPTRPLAEIALADIASGLRVAELDQGWQFELDSHRLLRMRHVADVGSDPPAPGWKIELQMDRPPATPVIPFVLLLPKGVAAYRQPDQVPIPGDPNEGVLYVSHKPPPAVLGSYAFYLDGIKLGHLYKPWLEDANGEREWCELELRGTALKVRLPHKWLSSAERAWPVMLDPYIGYTEIGAIDTSFTANYVLATGRSTPAENGNATRAEVYTPAPTATARTLGFYLDDAGEAGALAQDTAEDTASEIGWMGLDLDAPTPITSGSFYWAALCAKANLGMRRDAGPSHSSKYVAYTYQSGVLKNPFGSTSGLAWLYSVRIEYAPVGGAISGSTSLTFAATGAAKSKGALSGSTSLGFTATGAVKGKGALSGSSLLSFAVSGAIRDASATLAGRVVAGQVFHTGAVAGQLFTPGPAVDDDRVAGQVFHTGTVAGQIAA